MNCTHDCNGYPNQGHEMQYVLNEIWNYVVHNWDLLIISFVIIYLICIIYYWGSCVCCPMWHPETLFQNIQGLRTKYGWYSIIEFLFPKYNR